MRCPQCGRPIEDASEGGCPSCGLLLASITASSTQAPAPLASHTSLEPAPAAPLAATPAPPPGYPRFPYHGSAQYPQGAPTGYPPNYSAPSADPPGTLQGTPPTQAPRQSHSGLYIALGVTALALLLSGSAVAGLALATQGRLLGPVATPPPAAMPTPNIIFYDPMTASTSGWANDSYCFYGTDGYHVKAGYICFAPVGDLTRFDVSAQVKQVAGDTNWFYGLVFRWASKGNDYFFGVTSNGEWKVAVFVNGQRTDLVPYVANPAVQRGLNKINKLEVRGMQSHFDFFVNGKKVGHVDDATYPSGRVGVEGNTVSNVEVVYTAVQIGIPN